VPWPVSLVVKNGSKARVATSSFIPTPSSVTAISTYWPGRTSRCRRNRIHRARCCWPRWSGGRLPHRIAPALTVRLRMAVSSCTASASTGQTPPAPTTSSCAPPRPTRGNEERWLSSRLTSNSFGSSGCRPKMPAGWPRQDRRAVGADQRHVDGAAQALFGTVLPVLDRSLALSRFADDDRQKIVEVVRHAAGEAGRPRPFFCD